MTPLEKALEIARATIVKQEMYDLSWERNRFGLPPQSKPSPDFMEMARALLTLHARGERMREALEKIRDINTADCAKYVAIADRIAVDALVESE